MARLIHPAPRPEDVRFGLEAYEHNATHVTLPIDGLNRTVSWENELVRTSELTAMSMLLMRGCVL